MTFSAARISRSLRRNTTKTNKYNNFDTITASVSKGTQYQKCIGIRNSKLPATTPKATSNERCPNQKVNRREMLKLSKSQHQLTTTERYCENCRKRTKNEQRHQSFAIRCKKRTLLISNNCTFCHCQYTGNEDEC